MMVPVRDSQLWINTSMVEQGLLCPYNQLITFPNKAFKLTQSLSYRNLDIYEIGRIMFVLKIILN